MNKLRSKIKSDHLINVINSVFLKNELILLKTRNQNSFKNGDRSFSLPLVIPPIICLPQKMTCGLVICPLEKLCALITLILTLNPNLTWVRFRAGLDSLWAQMTGDRSNFGEGTNDLWGQTNFVRQIIRGQMTGDRKI